MITKETTGILLVTSGGVPGVPLEIEFQYDEARDPYAVGMVVRAGDESPVTWSFSRETLMRGSCNPWATGLGDVKVRLDRNSIPAQVIICLRSDEGHADIGVLQLPVIEFLNKTADAVKLGEEETEEAVDAFLEELFG